MRLSDSTHATRLTRLAAALLAVALFTMTACGGDDDTSDAEADRAEPSTTTTTEPTPTDTEPDGEETGGDFCALNDELAELFGQLAVSDDPEAVWGQIEQVVDQIVDAAPPELAADVATGATYYERARTALEAANWDVAALDSMPDDPETDQIEQQVNAYLGSNCP